MTEYAIRNNYIKPEDRDFYEYAYPLAFSYLVTWLSFLLIGALFGFFLPSVVYMLSFSSLRIFAGGIHAESYEKCYLVSLAVFIAVLGAAKWLVGYDCFLPIAILFTAGVAVVGRLAPIEDPNKPIDRQDAKKYSKRVKIIIAIQIAVLLALYFLKVSAVYSVLLMLGPITVAVLLIMAKAKIG